jgi:hypothetical protein
MARALLALGGIVFALLGAGHAFLTIRDLFQPRTFTPPGNELQQAMKNSTVAIHPASNLWQAWMGFNLSHALGVIVFGVTLTSIAITSIEFFERNLAIQIGGPVIGTIYIALARAFWYRDPFIGASLGTAVLTAAAVLV